MNVPKNLVLAVAALVLTSCSTGGQGPAGASDPAREQAVRDAADLITSGR